MRTSADGCEIRNQAGDECALPLEVTREYTLSGAGFGPPGTECIVSYERVACPAGHRYDLEVGSVEFPPEKEEG